MLGAWRDIPEHLHAYFGASSRPTDCQGSVTKTSSFPIIMRAFRRERPRPGSTFLIPGLPMNVLLRTGVRAACMLLCVLFVQPTDAATTSPAQPVWFDIPAMPLRDALDIYGQRTGMAVLVDSQLFQGRVSSAVRGRFAARVALTRLLRGTGLQAVYQGRSAFTLTRLPALPEQPLSRAGLDGASYAARLQRALDRALCSQPLTRAGGFRSALQLWVGPEGRVRKLHFLSFSGETRRDRAIAALLHELRPGPPNRALPNPVTVLIERAKDGRDCL